MNGAQESMKFESAQNVNPPIGIKRERPNRVHDLQGRRFGRLTAIRHRIFNRKSWWLCLCDCGNTKEVLATSLIRENTKSCGCLRRELRRQGNGPGESALKKLYRTYKKNCRKVNRVFELSLDRFKELTKQECYYCGKEPESVLKGDGNGDYIYNGIDRISSDIGYIENNVVTACKNCNYAKQSLSSEDFLLLIKKIHKHLNLGGL